MQLLMVSKRFQRENPTLAKGVDWCGDAVAARATRLDDERRRLAADAKAVAERVARERATEAADAAKRKAVDKGAATARMQKHKAAWRATVARERKAAESLRAPSKHGTVGGGGGMESKKVKAARAAAAAKVAAAATALEVRASHLMEPSRGADGQTRGLFDVELSGVGGIAAAVAEGAAAEDGAEKVQRVKASDILAGIEWYIKLFLGVYFADNLA